MRKDDCLNGLLETGVNGYAYETETEFLAGYQMLFDAQTALVETQVRASVQKLSSKAFGEHIEQIYLEVLDGELAKAS